MRKWILFVVLGTLGQSCVNNESECNHYLCANMVKDGLYIDHRAEEGYILIGQSDGEGRLKGKFIEAYDMNLETSDTAYGIGERIGNINKRVSYFNNENSILEILELKNGHLTTTEFVQYKKGVPTDRSFFIQISKLNKMFILKPIYKGRFDSLTLKRGKNLLQSSVKDYITIPESTIYDSISRESIEIGVWDRGVKDSVKLVSGFNKEITFERIVNFKEIQFIPDPNTDVGKKVRWYLSRELKAKVDQELKMRKQGSASLQ